MVILPKEIYTFNAIPIQIPMAFFHTHRTNNSEMCMKPQRLQIPNAVLRKKNKAEDIKLPDFKLCNNTVAIKCDNDMETDTETNRTEKKSPKLNSCIIWSIDN